MTERLMAAFADSAAWLSRFSRLDYAPAFREYCVRFLPDYLAAAEEAGDEGIPALAERLLDAMETHWKAERFWNRAVVRTDMKQVLTFYLTPALISEQSLRPLAAALRDGWNRRWPKEPYHAAGFDTICKGFKWKILGFEMPEKKKAEQSEDEV